MKTPLHRKVLLALLIAGSFFLPAATVMAQCSLVATNNGSNSGSCAPTGTITLYGSYGSAPYTYSLDGSNYQAANSFTGLAAGTYTGYVKDQNGCIASKANIVIGTFPALNITAYPRAASACTNSGSIELYRSGGAAPYTYSLDDITYQSSNTFSGLAEGSYSGWVKDAKGCKASVTGITVTKTAAMTVSLVKSNTSACTNDGYIRFTAAGGTPGYTYSLDDVTYQSNHLFTGLSAGTYNGWVKDARGCKIMESSIVLTSDAAPTITVSATPRKTSGCASDGSIDVYRTGGTAPFTYSINDINYQSGYSITGLAAGTYTVWVKDARGCKGSLTGVTVSQAATLNATRSFTNTSSCVNNGTVQLTAHGGTAPYTYSLTDVTYQSSNSFSGLSAGNYTAWIKDSKGCKASVPVSIAVNSIAVTAYKVAPGSCGASNGSIRLFRTGGTGPYTYSLDGSPFQSGNLFTGLGSGVYNGVVKDSKGCTGSAKITLGAQPASLTLNNVTDEISACINSDINSITYQVANGIANVTGLPAGVTSTTDAGVLTISGKPAIAGVYKFHITVTGTCNNAAGEGSITVHETPTASYTKTMLTSCGGGADGSITVTPGGSGSFSYAWSCPNGFSAATSAVTGLQPGDYTVDITDENACSLTIPDISIWQAQPVVVTNNGQNTASCSATGMITLYGSHGVKPYTYSLDGITYQEGAQFTGLPEGVYTGYIKDLGGCVSTKTNIVISKIPAVTVTAYAGAASSCASSNGVIQLFRSGGIAPFSYSIDGVNYQTGKIFSGLVPGVYTGYVKDGSGCVSTKANINVGPDCGRSISRTVKPGSAMKQVVTVPQLKLAAYPNPSNEAFTLTVAGKYTGTATIKVSDMTGKVMSQASLGKKQQYTFGHDLKAGVYIVEVITADSSQSIKVIKE